MVLANVCTSICKNNSIAFLKFSGSFVKQSFILSISKSMSSVFLSSGPVSDNSHSHIISTI